MSDWTTTVSHPASHPDRPALWAQAVDVLTRAIRLTRTRKNGEEEPDDFAEFFATALAAAAANVGSIERVTAGRPGSWEAAALHDLLSGLFPPELTPEALAAYRTEPVRLPLNVAQLVEDSGCLPTLYEADDAIAWPGHGDGSAEHPHGEGATEEELMAREDVSDTLRARYTDAYTRYAERFTAAAREAAQGIEGLLVEDDQGRPALRVPVEVVAETDPEEAWNAVINPSEWDDDPLVWTLWAAARERAGTPQLDEDRSS